MSLLCRKFITFSSTFLATTNIFAYQFKRYFQCILLYLKMIRTLIILLLSYSIFADHHKPYSNKHKHHSRHEVVQTSKQSEDDSDSDEDCGSMPTQEQQMRMNNKNAVRIISVIGGPGSGKGTQCQYLIKNFGFKHISLGDLFRREIKEKKSLARQIDQYMQQGQLVPGEIGVQLILNQIDKYNNKEIILLDGFPRNKQNMDSWAQLTSQQKQLDIFLLLECPMQVMFQRLVQRGASSGRSDDNAQTIRKRLQVFKSETEEVINNLLQNNKSTIIRINADQDIGEVSKQIHKKMVLAGFKPIKKE